MSNALDIADEFVSMTQKFSDVQRSIDPERWEEDMYQTKPTDRYTVVAEWLAIVATIQTWWQDCTITDRMAHKLLADTRQWTSDILEKWN